MGDYYAKYFPQSHYRRTDDAAERQSHRQIALNFPKLKLKKKEWEQLKPLIAQAYTQVASALLPEDLISDRDSQLLQTQILSKMGYTDAEAS